MEESVLMLQLRVNGTERSIDADPSMPLLWVIRDLLGLTGTKFGCGVGACGACAVHLDGQAIRSCITALADATDHDTDPAGVDGEPQCGYCQPRRIMLVAAVLRQNPKPSDQEITDVMSGNICRCGTYLRIRAAIKAATESPL